MAINPIGTLATKAAQVNVVTSVGDLVRSMWSTVYLTVDTFGLVDLPVPLPGWFDVSLNAGTDIVTLQAPGGWGQYVAPLCINARRIQLTCQINTLAEKVQWLALQAFLMSEKNLTTSRSIIHPELVAAGVTKVYINNIDIGPFRPSTGGSISISCIEDTDVKFVDGYGSPLSIEDVNFKAVAG